MSYTVPSHVFFVITLRHEMCPMDCIHIDAALFVCFLMKHPQTATFQLDGFGYLIVYE